MSLEPHETKPVADAPAGNPFAGREHQDVVAVRFVDGSLVEGCYLTQAGMHFVQKRGTAVGSVIGPLRLEDVSSVRLVKSRRDVLDDLFERKRGDLVPGRLVRTREGYETRLDVLARAAARAPDRRRRMQVEQQFDDVADEIELARTKRKWLLGVARWSSFSNEPPTKLDLSGGDMTAAARLQRPRPQDFDPDPVVRRARFIWPERVLTDPMSPPNMLKALRVAGFNARVSVVGEMTEDEVDLLVDLPGGKRSGRFHLSARRGASGEFVWRSGWEGNGSKADARRFSRATRSEAYVLFRQVVSRGLAVSPEVDADAPAMRI